MRASSAFRRSGWRKFAAVALPLLGQVSLPVSHSLAKLAQTGPDGARMAAAQAAASDFGALCRANPAPMGGIYRQKNIFLTN